MTQRAVAEEEFKCVGKSIKGKSNMAQRDMLAHSTLHMSTQPVTKWQAFFKYNDYLKRNLVCYLSIFPLQFLNVYEMSHEAFCMN